MKQPVNLETLDELVTLEAKKAGQENAERVTRNTIMLIADMLPPAYHYLYVNYNPIYFSNLPDTLAEAESMKRYAEINDANNLLDYAQLVRRYHTWRTSKLEKKSSSTTNMD